MAELVKNQLAWIETHSNFLANMPQKSVVALKMGIAILNFGCKTTVRLKTTIEKTNEKYVEFYKGIQLVHHQCLILMEPHIKFSRSEESICRICMKGYERKRTS